MAPYLQVRAHAKLNLHLRVGVKRPDGYHELETLFQSISLADVIGVELASSGTASVEMDPELEIPPEQNLALRAARSLLAAAGSELVPRVRVRKAIPAGAGLGGGSADAAGVLFATQRLLDEPLELQELLGIARRLGADVPFCLTGGSASARGIGEALQRERAGPLHAVVVTPPVFVPTPWAYRALDEYRETDHSAAGVQSRSLAQLVAKWAQGGPAALAGLCENSFEAVVFPAFPVTREARDALLERGAVWAMLSGSGSAVFGVYPDAEATAKAAAELARSHPDWVVHACTGVPQGVEVC